MKSAAPMVLALLFATSSAQTTHTFVPLRAAHFNDPANLGDERVKPRDGRELPVDRGALGLEQLLRRLNTRASILNIVAHPDDEDGGMLTLYSRGVGARVADLSLTRGEGGQNAMTGDFEDALGLLRTQELLSCDRYSGIDQFFGTEVDFGFSKTKEETFAKWTHERVLYDVVRAIRIYRPLVLTSTWVGGVTDGHGQHQASGEIAQEAFVAAGDPKVFPELTAEGILPWQPLKIYARVPQQAITGKGLFDYATGQYTPAQFKNYVTGEVTTTEPSTDVVVHEGTTDSLLADEAGKPRSYVQFARIGLSQQKSQVGPGGRMPPAGKFDVSYHRYGSMLPKDKQKGQEMSFFDGIDTSVAGIAELAPHAPPVVAALLQGVGLEVHQILDGLHDPQRSEKTVLLLADAMHRIDGALQLVETAPVDASFTALERANVLHELRVKRVQFNEALVCALGLSLKVQPPSVHVEGKPVAVHAELEISGPMPVGVDGWTNTEKPLKLTFKSGQSRNSEGQGLPMDVPAATPSPGHPVDLICKLDAGQSPATRPYFFRNDIERPTYELRDASLRNAPATPPALTCHVELALDWLLNQTQMVTLELNEVGSALAAPPVSLSLSRHAQVLPNDQRTFLLKAAVTPAEKPAIVPKLTLPAGWRSRLAPSDAGASGEVTLQVEAPNAQRSVSIVQASTRSAGGESVTEGYRSIGYGDLPRTNYYTPATDRIVPVDLKLPTSRKIGYLPGTGDGVPDALASIGITPTMLTVADLSVDNLKQFDSVVLGVRTYAAHPDLHGAPTQALLAYAKAGGNVVVQYQTAEFSGDDAPYPLSLGRDAEKVVDETDPVRLIEEPNDPAQRLLVVPNRIHPEDFNGWVEERGHGFLQSWDNHYSAPTETHDPGQDPQRGGLVTTQLGQGRWTYLAFAVYRQLPEAVPGAFRLFVNLLEK